jgi:tetratricopeptide (TPR) repeat protein
MQEPSTHAPAQPPGQRQWWLVPGLCLLLAAITFAVFGQTLRFGFVDYDDQVYIYNNPVVSKGLTLQGLKWAFSGVHAENWHPVTWLSHMLDCQLYGLNPAGHHFTNVLIHTATVIALFLLLRRMTGALWRSAFVAAVFAIHPLRAESVAWVSERKDVLSGLFFMLTVGAYARYARLPWSAARYGLVVLLFAIGLLCKPMLVTLPLVLLLLDYWPLRRAESARRLVLEKLPLLALSAASCVVTVFAQHETIRSVESYSLPYRLGNALAAGVIYLRQMIWPAGLVAHYPYPHYGLPALEVALSGLLLAVFSILALWQRQRRPWILVGWFWYLVMLLPVVGIVQVGIQAHADRYTYLPQIGLYLALTWLVAEWKLPRVAFGCLMGAVLAVLMVCGWNQVSYWKDSEVLWNHAIAFTTDNEPAYCGLAEGLFEKGKIDDAISVFRHALRLNRNLPMPQHNLGIALLQKGDLDEAIYHLGYAIYLNPDDPASHYALALALLRKGNVEEAAAHFQRTIQLDPDDAQARYNLGNILFDKGRTGDAIALYQGALQINPDYIQACINLANALLQEGKTGEAILHYQRALQIDPASATANLNLGVILLQHQDIDDAIACLQKALQTKPDLVEAHSSLGAAFLQQGKIPEAMAQYQQALQLQPNDPATQNSLAWLLATAPDPALRNGKQAVQLAQRANELAAGKNPFILRTLAAAQAELGHFDEAKNDAQNALELFQSAGRKDLAQVVNSDLKRYESGLPFHP